MKVVVIGAGPAGILAGISAAKAGNEVQILEKMNACGKKLLITGKGRCNITSSLAMEEFIKNTPGNGRFLYSAFSNFTNQDIIQLVEKHGVKVKEERGNRIFPVSDMAKDVLQALLAEIKERKVEIQTNTEVSQLLVKEQKIQGVMTKQGHKILADKVIIATGGMSYPVTGSTGDGYRLAKEVGHAITEIKPSLVALLAKEVNLCKQLQGLSLRNVGIKMINLENHKVVYEDFGEMLFTHFGVSGPTMLSASAHMLRIKNRDQLLADNKVIVEIDLKPALSEEKLDLRIRKDFEENRNRQFKNSLEALLPKKMITPIIELSGICPDKQVNEITKQERQDLLKLLKHFRITIKGFRDIKEAIITAGGINTKEINASTMESKLIQGLFFAGEVIDVDAYTGGFNLQIAYATGYTAGQN